MPLCAAGLVASRGKLRLRGCGLMFIMRCVLLMYFFVPFSRLKFFPVGHQAFRFTPGWKVS